VELGGMMSWKKVLSWWSQALVVAILIAIAIIVLGPRLNWLIF